MRYHSDTTPKMESLIAELDTYKFFIAHVPISPDRQQNLRRISLLKSSLFSARIEGNSLTLSQIEQDTLPTKTREKLEVQNILQAHNSLLSPSFPEALTVNEIQKIHEITLAGLDASAGQFRREFTAIFNQAGIAVYMTPDPADIVPQLEEMLNFMVTSSQHPYIRAIIGHFWFEKIHPFIDGNGRVGRLLLQVWLDHGGSNFNGLLNFEEQIEKTRSDYYYFLQRESKDVTEFVEYLLGQLVAAAKEVVESLQQPASDDLESTLLPRRQEILALLRDHQILTFDQIQRRFFEVRPSTLRYDLQQLIKARLAVKIGATRGALYRAR